MQHRGIRKRTSTVVSICDDDTKATLAESRQDSHGFAVSWDDFVQNGRLCCRCSRCPYQCLDSFPDRPAICFRIVSASTYGWLRPVRKRNPVAARKEKRRLQQNAAY